MSGHSKWSKIKRQKGASDAKRGQLFTKLGRGITLAVKDGGGTTDVDSNYKLRIAVDIAKQANMPKDNIKRAIDRGAGKGEGASALESVLYEGYGPFGIALMIEAVTDNKQRSSAQIKHVLSRSGGSLGTTGSVSFQFTQVGLILIDKDKGKEEELLDIAIEAGASDIQTVDEGFEIYTDRAELHIVKESLEKKGLELSSSELLYQPTATIPLSEKQLRSLESVIDQLEELDDVHKVYANDTEEVAV